MTTLPNSPKLIKGGLLPSQRHLEQRARSCTAPGEYEVSIRIGYAATAAPEPPKVGESVEAPVMRWQQTTVSPPVRMAIPPYARSQEHLEGLARNSGTSDRVDERS